MSGFGDGDVIPSHHPSAVHRLHLPSHFTVVQLHSHLRRLVRRVGCNYFVSVCVFVSVCARSLLPYRHSHTSYAMYVDVSPYTPRVSIKFEFPRQ